MEQLITVIIPFYNAEQYLAECLQSVFSQEGVQLEVIVVNDGSTDKSKNIALGFRAAYFEQEQNGTPSALNLGISKAQGSFLAFLDADDIWAKGKLAWQLDILSNRGDLDFVLGSIENFFSPELSFAEREEIYCPPPMGGYCPGAMLIRRSAFCRVGLFCEERKAGEFLDWYLRAKELGLRYIVEDKPALFRRIHKANKGRVNTEARNEYLSVLRESIKRKKSVPERASDD